MKNIKILSRGLFEKSFMDSRIKTRSVTNKEAVLGHLVGPLGMIMAVNTMYALVELFFTEQVPLDSIYGTGTYLSMTMTSRVLGTVLGLIMGWVFQHTASKQGRFRPWGLIGGLLVALAGIPLFLVWGPFDQTYLIVIFTCYIIQNVFGLTLYNSFANNIVALTTRSTPARTKIQFYRKLSLTLISGILIGLVLTSVVYYQILIHNRDSWAWLMIVLCVISIPLIFVEYFYTRERVMEDAAERTGSRDTEVPLMEQIKALLTNKYYILMLIGTTIAGIAGTMKGGNVTTNFCRWVLGADGENNIQMIYTILTGVPMGLGAIIAYPLAKRFGVRKVSFIGYFLVAIGSLLGLIFGGNVIMAYVAGFIRQVGYIADGYVFPALLAGVGDMVEYKSGFRPEGLLSASIIGLVLGIIHLPLGGMYETILLALGFDATLPVQAAGVQNWVTVCFFGFDLVMAAVWVIVLCFFDVEEKLPAVSAELEQRKKDAMLSRGEKWVDPEELDRIERERQNKVDEENRIADLKVKCRKKGLDFDTENSKYLAKTAAKKAKAEAKAAKKRTKQDE